MAGVPVIIVGELTYQGLQVGGGPMPGGGGAPGYPTHPWVPPYGPSHPIAPGGPPPQIWGPIGNYPDAGFPGPQPGGPTYPSTGPGFPTNPIAEPPWGWGGKPPQRPPLGFWGGSGVGDYIDAGGPGPQPGGPITIWGPIGDYIDAGFPEPQPPLPPVINDRPVEWKVAWSPATGWIVVGIPTVPVPTPSK
jgi:hypothetical protein